jgi:hypothetical protein
VKTFRLNELVCDSNLGRTLALAVLGVVNEVRDVFGQAEAVITVHRGCKLTLLLPYQMLVGLAIERGVKTDDDKVATYIEELLSGTTAPKRYYARQCFEKEYSDVSQNVSLNANR